MKEDPTRVCLIDDSMGDSKLLLDLLNSGNGLKYKVSHYTNLSDGISELAKKKFDILLLDLFLPDSEGLETFDIIQGNDVDIPIIILTGLEDETLALKALQFGAQDYLIKGDFDRKLLYRS